MPAEERTYKGLRDLHTASDLADKRSELEDLRSADKKEWALNRAFYNNQQWAYWNSDSGRVESLPDTEARWKVRLTSNQILPGVSHYVAQLTKTRPVIEAEPDSGADGDVKSAEMAGALYDYWWDCHALTTKHQSALVLAQLSAGFWKISWDPLANKAYTFTVGPDGQPITDDQLAQAYLDSLKEQGVPEEAIEQWFKRTVYLGDIRIEPMPGENVLIDPVPSQFEECQYAICTHLMDPDEIEARWGKKVTPDAISVDSEMPLPFATKREQKPKTVRRVFIGYFRPSPSLRKGRYVVWIEDPNEILADVDWPFPFQELPLIKFPGLERPGSAYDEALVTAIRPMQKDLNKGLSQIVEHRNLTVKPQMLAPTGSLRQQLTGEPGAVFFFNPIGNAVPQWREIPTLPQYVFSHLADIQNRIDQAFNRLPSQRDQLPARVDSGQSIELIQEAVADQITPVVRRNEDALARAGHLMVALAQKYYEEPRLLKIKGAGGSVRVKKFMAADIQGGFSFRAKSGTGLPKTRAGRREHIKELIELGVMDIQTAKKYLDLADYKGLQAQMAADEDQAHREHDKLLKGEPLNPYAMQQAEQQAMQMLQMAMDGEPDPETGEVLDPQQVVEMAQSAIQEAGLSPLMQEDKNTHAEIHRLFMTSPEFENYPPEIQAGFFQHYESTMQTIAAETPVDPALLPKVNVAARATTSAPVLGQILRKAGIDVDDEQVAEEPLETAVYDSMDKPDADSAANDPFSEAEQVAQAERDEDTHQLALAKAQHDLAAAADKAARESDKAAREDMNADVQAEREQELHEEKLRQMRQPKPAASGR